VLNRIHGGIGQYRIESRSLATWIGLAPLLALSFSLAGCERTAPSKGRLVPVSGVLRLDGEPVADARIVMIPLNPTHGIDWQLSYGQTDREGRYEMKTRDGRTGVLVGPQLVVISKPDPAGRSNAGFLPEFLREPAFATTHDEFPTFYNRESSLQFVVSPEEKGISVDWDLTSIDPLLRDE